MDGVDPKGDGQTDLRRRPVHVLPAGRPAHAAEHLRPPRRRRHRLPGQRRLRISRPDPRHRRPLQQAGQFAGSRRRVAGRRHLRPLASDGRHARSTRRAHVTGDTRRRFGPLCDLRQGRDLLVASTGAEPVTGPIYDAWASLGFERGALGLPTSGLIQEPEWIVQNFQHGTLNVDRQTSSITRVMDGIPLQLPPPSASGPPVQLERFSPARNLV